MNIKHFLIYTLFFIILLLIIEYYIKNILFLKIDNAIQCFSKYYTDIKQNYDR
jgi:hypothetical protein